MCFLLSLSTTINLSKKSVTVNTCLKRNILGVTDSDPSFDEASVDSLKIFKDVFDRCCKFQRNAFDTFISATVDNVRRFFQFIGSSFPHVVSGYKSEDSAISTFAKFPYMVSNFWIMEEQVGFEPTELRSKFNSLAGSPLRPLGHCSKL